MAVPNPALRFATNVFDTNGTTTDWEVNFVGGYINPSYVYARSYAIDPDTQLEVDPQDHAVSIVSSSGDAATVRVSPAVATGRKLYIYRSTPVGAMLVDYVNGSLPSRANLNLSNEQLLDIIQELMDNVNLTNAAAEGSVGVIIDIRDLINEVYNTVLTMLQNGGIISVAPRTWAGTWTGDEADDDQFDMPGADVTDAGFYDVYVNGIGMQPDVDYSITIPTDATIDPYITFTDIPAEGSSWFATLRGYAKPYTDTIVSEQDLRIKFQTATGTVAYADGTLEFGCLRCENEVGTVVTINTIPLVGTGNFSTGSYFSVRQVGGPVTIVGDVDVTLNVPTGCLAAARAVGSVVTCVCEDAGTNTWFLAGDLAKGA